MELNKLLAQIEKYVLYLLLFLFPIFVLPISPNPFVVPKSAILVFGIVLVLLIKSARVIASGKLEYRAGRFDLPVAIIAIAYLASTIFRTPNDMEAYLLPGNATIIIGGAILYFLVNQLDDSDKKFAGLTLFFSAALYSVFVLLSFSGIFSRINALPAFMKAEGFTPEGGYLPSAIFLVVMMPLGAAFLLSEEDVAAKALAGVSMAVVLFALLISVYNILPGSRFAPRFPSMGVSWGIAVDSLKESPLLGVGPGNYLTAFNRFRPIEFNTTELWAIKFSTAGNYFMTMITETGMLGLAGFLLLIYTVYKVISKDIREKKLVKWGVASNLYLLSLGLILLSLFVFPATGLIVITLFVILSINAKSSSSELNLTTSTPGAENLQTSQKVASKVPALLLTIPVIAIAIFVSYRAFRILKAEYIFNKSLNSLAANDVRNTYEQMATAIQMNPQVDRYHSAFSRVNLAIADSIARQAQDGEVSEADRQRITLLIQQSIQSAKNTVATNPLRSGNWEVLGRTYRSIMPFAQGADAFAVQSLRNAVALDPFNPNLRITLGGVYFALQDYNAAVDEFERAVAVKNDHANAHYNLAYALKEAGELEQARTEMSNVLGLIADRNSQDYEIARQALEDFQAELESEARTGQDLNPPADAEEPVLDPQLDLPEGSEPPESPITPTPVPADELTGQGTPTPTPEEEEE